MLFGNGECKYFGLFRKLGVLFDESVWVMTSIFGQVLKKKYVVFFKCNCTI